MKIPKPTINHAINIVLIIALLFSTLCSNPVVIVNGGITQDELNNALERQKEQMLQDIDLKIEQNAFKNIQKIDSLMSDIDIRDSLRRAVFGR